MSGKRSNRQKKKPKAQTQSRRRTAPEAAREDSLWSRIGLRDEFAEEQQRVSELIVSCWIDILEQRISEREAALTGPPARRDEDVEITELTVGDWAKDEVLDQLREVCTTQPKRYWDEYTFVFARYELPRQRIVS